MTAREKMIAKREKMKIPHKYLAKKIGISEILLKMIEHGEVTHPKIVEKIRDFYKLTELEAEELLPKHRRPHGGDYEPDRFVQPETELTKIPNVKKTVIETYIAENQDRMVRQHQRRGQY